MRGDFTLVMTSVAMGCTSVMAFSPPVCVRNPEAVLLPSIHLSRRVCVPRMQAEASHAALDSHSHASGDHGSSVPRVGGPMPAERPGWFRVPAPGGKHTKVGGLRKSTTLIECGNRALLPTVKSTPTVPPPASTSFARLHGCYPAILEAVENSVPLSQLLPGSRSSFTSPQECYPSPPVPVHLRREKAAAVHAKQ